MRALLQRVAGSRVEVDGKIVGATGPGLLILLGVANTDTPADARRLAGRSARQRLFVDGDGKMNLSLLDRAATATAAAGNAVDKPADALVVSQFTLYADTRQGNRPGFSAAAPGEKAEPLYNEFCDELARQGLRVARGVFGAKMAVALVNDGPVTIMLEQPFNR